MAEITIDRRPLALATLPITDDFVRDAVTDDVVAAPSGPIDTNAVLDWCSYCGGAECDCDLLAWHR